MEYYGLRKAGDDIDFIITEKDYKRLLKKYQDQQKDLWGDLGISVFNFEMWNTVLAFNYSDLSINAIEKENFLIISLEKLLLMKALGMKDPKYNKDLELLVDAIIDRQYPKTIIKATENRIDDIFTLLDNAQLPKEGVQKNLHNSFIVPVKNTNKLLGCGNLEIYEDEALLRSLAVHSSYYNKGLGSQLVKHIHEYATNIGIKRIYLLTTTAETFFKKFNYHIIARTDVSPKVQQSVELKSLYPRHTTCMVKNFKN